MRQLKLEEREIVLELTEHPAFKTLIMCLDALAADQYNAMIQLDAESATDRQILIKKARAEGAKRLSFSFQEWLSSLKPKAQKLRQR